MLDSLPQCDEVLCVLDRATDATRIYLDEMMGRKFPSYSFRRIDGEPGYRNPAAAWNKAYQAVATEFIYQFSSECIHQPDNVTNALKWLKVAPCVVFGKARDSGEYGGVVTGPDPLLLTDAAHPRPLGFVMAFPSWAIRAIEGQDEEYMKGQGYEDDDFVYRLWQLGIPFIFDDSIQVVHQAHPRAHYDTDEGKAGYEVNRQYTVAKWGSEHPWHDAPKKWLRRDGLSIAVPAHGSPGLVKAWERFAHVK
jgi:hypothetical protein